MTWLCSSSPIFVRDICQCTLSVVPPSNVLFYWHWLHHGLPLIVCLGWWSLQTSYLSVRGTKVAQWLCGRFISTRLTICEWSSVSLVTHAIATYMYMYVYMSKLGLATFYMCTCLHNSCVTLAALVCVACISCNDTILQGWTLGGWQEKGYHSRYHHD